jgi:NAD-dependent dihydropyrimidine dehydrogenase PreA subunit
MGDEYPYPQVTIGEAGGAQGGDMIGNWWVFDECHGCRYGSCDFMCPVTYDKQKRLDINKEQGDEP